VSIPPTESWTLLHGGLVFLVCAAIIAAAGTRITRVVDQLADRTGIGEAAAGAVLMMGLIRRERHGIGKIGTESAVIMVLYVFVVMLLLGGIQTTG